MSGGTPPLARACEPREEREASLRARAACPFCALQAVTPAALQLHVARAHLDLLSPELQLVFLEQSSPGYEEDKVMADGCGSSGWPSPEPERGAISKLGAGRGPRGGGGGGGGRGAERRLDGGRHRSSAEDQHQRDRVMNGGPGDSEDTNKKLVSGAGQGSPLRSALALQLKPNTPKKHVPSPSPTVQCLMCEFTSTDPQKLEEHINRAHFDLTSPSVPPQPGARNPTAGLAAPSAAVQFTCPICDTDFSNGSEVEMHVNVEHQDILSPQKMEELDNARSDRGAGAGSSPCTSCPVCGAALSRSGSQQDLMAHIEEHFEQDESAEQAALSAAEREARRAAEQQQLDQLRRQYGMEEGGADGYSGGAAHSLRRAVCSGELSVADYYERSVGLRRCSSEGVEDRACCTAGITEHVAALSAQNSCILHTHLCSDVDHYASTYGDRGWGCGYRNMQMVLSTLLRHPRYSELVWRGVWEGDGNRSRTAIPSIPKLQLMIERAWQIGFDLQGSEQLGSKLHNTRKWIGACEVVTLLSSLWIRCELVDFHRPTGEDGGHPALLDWVLRYFSREPEQFKPPLYLQHQGHSRTIIGYERYRDGRGTLLILDPSHASAQVQQLVTGTAAAQSGALRLLRRGPAALRAKQYQLVAIGGVIQNLREYEERKILQSVRIPQDR